MQQHVMDHKREAKRQKIFKMWNIEVRTLLHICCQ